MNYHRLYHAFYWLVLTIFFVSPYELHPQNSDLQYAYFFSTKGEYVKVEIVSDRVVVRGSLLDVKEARDLFPGFFRETGIGVGGYDPRTGRLYILAPQQEFLSDDNTIRYRVVVFEMPSFRLVANAELAKPVYTGPTILLTPDGNRLLVNYQVLAEEDYWVFVNETYDTKNLERVEIKHERIAKKSASPEAILKVKLSQKARFAPDGKTIINTTDASSEEYEIVGDQVSRRVRVPWPKDVLEYRNTHADFFTEQVDEMNQRFLLWELKQNREVNGRYRQRYATGRFAFYDPQAKPQLKEFVIKELEGDNPKIVAITPGRGKIYFALGEKLYALDPTRGITPVNINLDGLSGSAVECIFADR